MSYRIEPVPPDPECWEEIAVFLARFTVDGELEKPGEGDDDPAAWRTRFRWWWVDNPFCEDESPRGFLLRTADGHLVGFHGLIPCEYGRGGRRIPGLMTTTFFVRKAHRAAALGVFLRVNRLGNRHVLIDGTPSPEMCALLERFRFQSRNRMCESICALPRHGRQPRSWAVRTLRVLQSSPRDSVEIGGRWTRDPGGANGDIPCADHAIRSVVSRESLAWQLRSGSEEKAFLGWTDEAGDLRAWLLARKRWRRGFCFLQVMDHGSRDGTSLSRFLRRIQQHPRVEALPVEADFLVWTDLDGQGNPLSAFFRRQRDCALYYRLPDSWRDWEKVCRPVETDGLLF